MYRKFKQEYGGFSPYALLPPITPQQNNMGCCPSNSFEVTGGSGIEENHGFKPLAEDSNSNNPPSKNDDVMQLKSQAETMKHASPPPPSPPAPPSHNGDNPKQAMLKKRISNVMKREKTGIKTDFKKLVKKVSDLRNSNLDNYTEEILRGKITVECPPTAKIVRIFTSSTFTDTRHERNYLMEKIYPRLKEFCQNLGYEFQVVDMRWGVRDEATDDHMTTELCLREVDLCNKLSTGPSFVTFLSHKYGYRDIQREIEAEEFEKLYEAATTDKIRNLLSRWFTRDDNSVPPTYILQPISSRIPHFISENENEKSKAKDLWNSEREEMRQGLVEAARQILDSDSKYVRSVTETEIDRGLINGGERAYWFERRIKGIETAQPSDVLRRYTECIGTEEYINESHKLLSELREQKLRSKIPATNILTYPIHWTNKGIDPMTDKAHKLYIEKLGDDFEKTMKKSVLKAIVQKEVDLINTPLYQEVFQHIIFCQEKCKAFYGREETFHIIQDYMNDAKNDEPLIIHGESGSGKTSIMAMAVKNAWSTEVDQTTIIRFLGTTPDSSNIGSLLLSVINQIRTVYNQDLVKSGLTLKELAQEFENTLELAIEDRPLLVVLDSLDQLDITGGARQLFWLPSKIPKHVKMIVSTLPEPEYECFPRLQAMFTNPKQFLPVSTLSNHDVEGILNKWLENKNRKLLDHQLKVVIDAFHKCPIPLFLKLAFDEACRWKSFTTADQSVLNTTVRTVINDLFNRIEKLHGELLVSRALGYLTLSSAGLTEAELEDILSCDDDVLNDVYMYWTPPIRRLPPLLLVRIKAELGQYFVDRGSDGVRVFYWYHRQFIEAAFDKYCSDEKTKKKMHGVLADYFSGVWADGKKKSYTSRSGESSSADRFVAAQPIKFSNKENQSESLNLRKLNNLPHHRLHADQKELLKSECLCNFDFILHKLKGSGLRTLLDDFSEAKQKYEDDTDICSICDALQLSQHSLQYNPEELSSQLLGRLKSNQGLEKLLEDCKNTPFHYLLPSKSMLVQPGGSLLYCLANHTNDIYGLDLDKTGELAVTCAYDNTIKVISVKTGKLRKSFDIEGSDPENVRFCNNDETLIVTCDDCVLAVQCQTGLKQYTIKLKDKGSVGICGENKETIGVFGGTMVILYDAANGKMIRAVDCEFLKEKELSFGSYVVCVGSKRYMATIDDDNYKVIVFDAETSQFLHMTNIFEPYKDSDGDDTQDTVDAMVISPDCNHIIVSSMMKNDLLIYDITNMALVREIKGESKDSCEKYQMTPDGKTLYFPYHNEVIAYDMEKEERFVAIHHPTNVENVSTLDMKIFVTTGDDRIVRIWDRSRTDGDSHHKSTSGKAVIGKCETLKHNPRYVITKTKEKKGDKDNFLEIVDLSKDEVVKRDKFIENLLFIHNLEGTRYLISNSESVVVYNAKTGEIEKSFEGVIPKNARREIQVFPTQKEFCVLSRGRKNLKIIDIETGKIEIIKGCGERMDDIVMNETGTRIACSIRDSDEAVLFDMEKKQVLYEMKANMIPGCKKEDTLYIVGSILTDDGKYFILSQDLTPNCIKHIDTASSVALPVVWNIETKKANQILCDEKYVKMYANPDLETQTTYDITEMKLLDKTTLLSSHDDYIVRVFNFETGSLLRRLFGHTSNVEMSVNIKSPFFLTFATWSEENAIRVWDRKTFECLASYCVDSGIDYVQFSPDGYRIIAQPKNEYPLYFEVKGGTDDKHKPNKQLVQYEELFHPTDLINEIQIPSGDADAPNDYDDDPPEPKSDSDNDDKDLDDSDSDDDFSSDESD